MIDQVQGLIDQYLKWLHDNTALRQIGEWVEITTPFLDRHNDSLQIYVHKQGDELVLTDDSHTIQDLRMSGCELRSKRRQDLLRVTLNGFGVRLENEALVVTSSPANFAQKKHNLLQAMLALNDLFYLAPAAVANVFLEVVAAWLNLSDVRYIHNVKFTGASGYDHVFDFVIPASRIAPERILRAINKPNRDTAQTIAFAWVDTRNVREPDSRAYALLNDAEHDPPPEVVDALRNYDVKPILWSRRNDAREELAA